MTSERNIQQEIVAKVILDKLRRRSRLLRRTRIQWTTRIVEWVFFISVLWNLIHPRLMMPYLLVAPFLLIQFQNRQTNTRINAILDLLDLTEEVPPQNILKAEEVGGGSSALVPRVERYSIE